MNRLHFCVFLLLLALTSATSAYSYPNYLEDFRRDPLRRPEVDGCQTCHMSPQGGDERNPFGLAFAGAGAQITPMLRSRFPDRFAYPTAPGAGNIVFHFSDPANRQVIVESAGTRMLLDVQARTVDGSAAAPARTALSGAAPPPVEASPVDPFAREGAFLGSQVVNLPNGKPIPAGGVDFTIQHRFLQDVDSAGWGGLFGFDSSAYILFGARFGITDRWSMAFARTNQDKTVEFSSTLNLVRQEDGASPLTFALRAGVEGRNNFHTDFSPYIQPIATTTIADRVSFTLAPTFAFNTRQESFFERFGVEHRDTISLGIGAGIRLFPSASLVGEYIPRLWGYRGEDKDRPGVSIGLQKSTYRHTFALVVSRQEPMTTSRYAVQGTDLFKIGFNIYRKIR